LADVDETLQVDFEFEAEGSEGMAIIDELDQMMPILPVPQFDEVAVMEIMLVGAEVGSYQLYRVVEGQYVLVDLYLMHIPLVVVLGGPFVRPYQQHPLHSPSPYKILAELSHHLDVVKGFRIGKEHPDVHKQLLFGLLEPGEEGGDVCSRVDLIAVASQPPIALLLRLRLGLLFQPQYQCPAALLQPDQLGLLRWHVLAQ